MLTICNTHYVLHHPAPPPLRLFCGTPTSCNGYEVAHPPSAESGRHEHTQRHDWPVAETKICSAQDHPARLLRLADSLKFDCEAGYRDLTGFEVESRGTDNNPLLLSPRSVSTPPRNKAIKSSSFFQIKQEEGKTKSISRRQKRFLLVVGEDQWSVSDHIKDGAVKNLPQT